MSKQISSEKQAGERTQFSKYNEQLTGRNAQRRKLGNNTYVERRGADSIALRLHYTDILLFNRDGETVANSGGWKTVTTKARLNQYLPDGFGISQRGGIWYWTQYNGTFHDLGVYTDGDTIKKGKLVAQAKPSEEKAQAKFRKRVLKYAKACAAALPLPEPNGGDCWHCVMKTEQGETLGDVCEDTAHIRGHIDEGYIVPSLVYNAMIERGWAGKIPLAAAFGHFDEMLDCARREVKNAVARYIFKRYGMAYK